MLDTDVIKAASEVAEHPYEKDVWASFLHLRCAMEKLSDDELNDLEDQLDFWHFTGIKGPRIKSLLASLDRAANHWSPDHKLTP